MRARQYKVQQYNDARFSSITCCTSSVLYISFSLGCYISQNYTKPSLIGFNMDLLVLSLFMQ